MQHGQDHGKDHRKSNSSVSFVDSKCKYSNADSKRCGFQKMWTRKDVALQGFGLEKMWTRREVDSKR